MSISINNQTAPFKMQEKIEDIELKNMSDHCLIPSLIGSINSDQDHKIFDIKTVLINHCRLNDAEYNALAKMIANCPNLNSVILVNNAIDIKHIHQLFYSLSTVHLTSLIFSDNWLGEEDAEAFVLALEKYNWLSHLDLSLNGLGDNGANLLVCTLKNKQSLTDLNLSCNDIHLAGVKSVAKFLCEQLYISAIDLSYNYIDAKGSKYIASIIENSKIKHLNLSSNKIGNQGAEYIAKALKSNSHLKSLNISDNEIDAERISYIIESALEHRSLKKLNISHNKINCEDKLVKRKKELLNHMELLI